MQKQIHKLDSIAISVKSHRLLKQLLQENPRLEEIMIRSCNEIEALEGVRNWITEELKKDSESFEYYKGKKEGRIAYQKLAWKDFAAIRILDYIDHADREFEDKNLVDENAYSNPVKLIWLAANFGTGGAKPDFFMDMLQLFRQLSNKMKQNKPDKNKVIEWADRWCSGLDPRIVKLREENRNRILRIIIEKIDSGELKSSKFYFTPGLSYEQKYSTALKWWDQNSFHLHFAIRTPDMLNELLGNSLDPDTMKILYEAEEKGIPFFVNPYYLSLLHVRVPYFAIGTDLAIRNYVLYSKQLVNEYGRIEAWEKEDQIEEGKPNAAGWYLPPYNNIHRRYPEVAILIPDTMARACGGLCSSCQRMYDFQRGNLNFKLDHLHPKESWNDKLKVLLNYFAEDSQLRDILITGGDALMSSDKSLSKILDEILVMTQNKKEANKKRTNGEKYAEIVRVRLGSRLPVYLPQRITPELINILSNFRSEASKLGVSQFIIQTHFESPMEVTPSVKKAIELLISSGWLITNQLVFTTAASRRGHSSKLRQVLNEIGILCYYTFSVKGYMENNSNFATNERAVQEQIEEKVIGNVSEKDQSLLRNISNDAKNIKENIADLLKDKNLPFLSTDRNVLNLPGVGKSLSFRTIGITRYGRRILEFSFDHTRSHSPFIEEMDKVIVIESKSISEYLRQLEEMGEDIYEYESIWGYSIGETEKITPIYEYPEYDFKITKTTTNIAENPE